MIEKFRASGAAIVLSLSAGLLVFFYGYQGPDYSMRGVIPDVILTTFLSMVIGCSMSPTDKTKNSPDWGMIVGFLAIMTITMFIIIYMNMETCRKQEIISGPMPFFIGLVVSLFAFFQQKFKHEH